MKRVHQLRKNRRSQAGFTLLEIMIAVLLLSIGLVAMMAMQVVFIQGGSTARNISVATQMGESVVEQMRGEAVNWSRTNSALNPVNQPILFGAVQNMGSYNVAYDGRALTPTFLPRLSTNANYDKSSDIALASASINARYCVDVQTNWMDAGQTVLVGQVRVSWHTNGDQPWANADVKCTTGANMTASLFPGGFGAEQNPDWNFVHVPFSVQQHNY